MLSVGWNLKVVLLIVGILNAVALGYIIYLNSKPEPDQTPIESTIINTIYDSTRIETKPVYLTEIKEKILKDTIVLKIPAQIDTLAIIRQYFTARYYCQDFRDSNVVITIHDTIRYNQLAYRSMSYQLLQPVVHETINMLKPPTFNWMAGMTYGWRKEYPDVIPSFGIAYRNWTLMGGWNLVYKQPVISLTLN